MTDRTLSARAEPRCSTASCCSAVELDPFVEVRSKVHREIEREREALEASYAGRAARARWHTRRMRFTTTLDPAGKNAAGFRVPREVVEALGKGKRPPVVVTINGYSYRNTVAVYGDEFLIGVAQEHRGPAGVKPGDTIEVDLQLDTAPREVDVPADFAAALEAAPAAKRAFEALSYSNRRRYTLSIEDAKSAETRQRRIDKSVSQLEAEAR